MAEPKDAEKAMGVVREWIETAAKAHGRELDPRCTQTFEAQNLAKFKTVFSDGNWLAAKRNLQVVTELHGRLSAGLSMLREPMAAKVDIKWFIEAGKFLRDHCKPSSRDDIHAHRKEGDWCTWP
jgi:hypothetical protein